MDEIKQRINAVERRFYALSDTIDVVRSEVIQAGFDLAKIIESMNPKPAVDLAAIQRAMGDLMALQDDLARKYMAGEAVGIDGVCRRLHVIIGALVDAVPAPEGSNCDVCGGDDEVEVRSSAGVTYTRCPRCGGN